MTPPRHLICLQETSREPRTQIAIEIWTFHFLRRPTFKGRACIPLQDVIERKQVRGRWELEGVASGAVCMELAWTSAAETWL